MSRSETLKGALAGGLIAFAGAVSAQQAAAPQGVDQAVALEAATMQVCLFEGALLVLPYRDFPDGQLDAIGVWTGAGIARRDGSRLNVTLGDVYLQADGRNSLLVDHGEISPGTCAEHDGELDALLASLLGAADAQSAARAFEALSGGITERSARIEELEGEVRELRRERDTARQQVSSLESNLEGVTAALEVTRARVATLARAGAEEAADTMRVCRRAMDFLGTIISDLRHPRLDASTLPIYADRLQVIRDQCSGLPQEP